MLNRIRKQTGTAGLIVAVVALVAALGGAAFAQPVATTSNKLVKQVKQALNIGKAANKRSVNAIKLARQANNKAGQPGPVGPQGAPGAPGANGLDGAPGQNGTNGTNGADGKDGKDGKDGADGKDGKDGETGFTATLPSGETETGTWSYSGSAGTALAPISFSIPLDAPLDEDHVHYRPPASPATAECPGSPAIPIAADGHLCVYAQQQNSVDPASTPRPLIPSTAAVPNAFGGKNAGTKGAGTNGSVVAFLLEFGGLGYGSWAVTAE